LKVMATVLVPVLMASIVASMRITGEEAER